MIYLDILPIENCCKAIVVSSNNEVVATLTPSTGGPAPGPSSPEQLPSVEQSPTSTSSILSSEFAAPLTLHKSADWP